ncbi:hypothetical protein BH24ACT5_BH24ACT5_07650 [soil metagenome]
MGASLDHVLVVGGTPHQWSARSEQEWADLTERLGLIAAEAGARWLTMRPYGPDPSAPEAAGGSRADRWWVLTAGDRCTVVVDPTVDGRVEFTEAVATIPPDHPIDERTVADALYAPADAEPDLILIVGPRNRLPPSLVWELAYGELVYADAVAPPDDASAVADELARQLSAAIEDYHGRIRRFGGLSPS